MINLAVLADNDLDRIERAGLLSSQRVLARMRSGIVRSYRTSHKYSAQAELLNNLVPVMAKTMAISHCMGRRRSNLMAQAQGAISLDRFSEVMRQVRAAGVGEDIPRLQRKYARRLYDQMRLMGANIDATTRATIANLVVSREPPGPGMKILLAALDKLGVGEIGQSKLETIYRTESTVAYHAGRWQQDRSRDDVWGYRYVTMRDDRVRPGHAAMDKTTLPWDDMFWLTHWPPNGWRCRCQVVTLYRKNKIVRPGPGAKVDDGFGSMQIVDDGNAVMEFSGFDENEPRDYVGRWTTEITAEKVGKILENQHHHIQAREKEKEYGSLANSV